MLLIIASSLFMHQPRDLTSPLVPCSRKHLGTANHMWLAALRFGGQERRWCGRDKSGFFVSELDLLHGLMQGITFEGD
jgi:hypothetical protein